MHTALEILDEVISLGQRELKALHNNELNKVFAMAEHRTRLVTQAWDVRQDHENAAYKAKLIKIQAMHEHLTAETERKKQEIQKNLAHSRKETRRLAGYKKAMNFA